MIEFDRRVSGSATCFASGASPSDRRRLLSFRGPVAVFVDGRRIQGDPGAVELHPGAQIVLEVGGYVPPHRTYLFPPRG